MYSDGTEKPPICRFCLQISGLNDFPFLSDVFGWRWRDSTNCHIWGIVEFVYWFVYLRTPFIYF